jgi:hypothetical protein
VTHPSAIASSPEQYRELAIHLTHALHHARQTGGRFVVDLREVRHGMARGFQTTIRVVGGTDPYEA